MKIVTENTAYLQKYDLGFLIDREVPMPRSLIEDYFRENYLVIDNNTRYDFVSFSKLEQIEFIKGLDFILDYHVLKDLTKDECLEMGQKFVEEKRSLAKRYNAMSLEEKEKNEDLYQKCDQLDFQIYSMIDFIRFREGSLKMKFPKEIQIETNPFKYKLFTKWKKNAQ